MCDAPYRTERPPNNILCCRVAYSRSGFQDVSAVDMTEDFVDVLNKEMSKFRDIKDKFIQVCTRSNLIT